MQDIVIVTLLRDRFFFLPSKSFEFCSGGQSLLQIIMSLQALLGLILSDLYCRARLFESHSQGLALRFDSYVLLVSHPCTAVWNVLLGKMQKQSRDHPLLLPFSQQMSEIYENRGFIILCLVF